MCRLGWFSIWKPVDEKLEERGHGFCEVESEALHDAMCPLENNMLPCQVEKQSRPLSLTSMDHPPADIKSSPSDISSYEIKFPILVKFRLQNGKCRFSSDSAMIIYIFLAPNRR